jgi:hypothetical protein
MGDIKGETESLIVVAQDQALGTNYFKEKSNERRNQK